MRRLSGLLILSLSVPSYRIIALDPSNSASIALATSALLLFVSHCNTVQLIDQSLPSLLAFVIRLELLSDHRTGAQSVFFFKFNFKSPLWIFSRHELI